jgi:hypothetical protein
MIFNSLKLLFVANKLQITAEELFLVQTIYDYQKGNENFDRDYLKTLRANYMQYYEKHDVNWDTMINNLVGKGYLEDYRVSKEKYGLSELLVSPLFLELSGNSETDEELFEKVKAHYPAYYYTGFKDETRLNVNANAREEAEMLSSFKKKILSGNRAKNWEQFFYILSELHPGGRDGVSSFKLDRFINTFWDNLEEHKKTLGI